MSIGTDIHRITPEPGERELAIKAFQEAFRARDQEAMAVARLAITHATAKERQFPDL